MFTKYSVGRIQTDIQLTSIETNDNLIQIQTRAQWVVLISMYSASLNSKRNTYLTWKNIKIPKLK